jgi:hypothetical protein
MPTPAIFFHIQYLLDVDPTVALLFFHTPSGLDLLIASELAAYFGNGLGHSFTQVLACRWNHTCLPTRHIVAQAVSRACAESHRPPSDPPNSHAFHDKPPGERQVRCFDIGR